MRIARNRWQFARRGAAELVAIHRVGQPRHAVRRLNQNGGIRLGQHRVDPLLPRQPQRFRAAPKIFGIGEAIGLFGFEESLLLEERHFRRLVRVVERDHLRERPRGHRFWRGGEISVEIGLQFDMQHLSLGRADSVELGLFDIDQHRALRLQHAERGFILRLQHRGHVGMQHGDAHTLQRGGLQGVNEARRCRAIFGLTRRRRIGGVEPDHPGEQDSGITNAARHRPRRILTMADRHDMRAADPTERRLQPDQPVHRRRANDRSVGLGPHRRRREARRDRRARPARRSTTRPVERVRIAHQPADRAPPADRIGGADIRPFAEVGLAQNHRPLRAQIGDERRVAQRDIVFERQAPRSGRDRVFGFDIILDQHRHAVERPERLAAFPPRISRARLRHRIGIDRNHRAQRRPGAVHRGDAREIGLRDRLRRRPARHHRLQLVD